MLDYGRMPSKTEIGTEAGLSRQTVHKHLTNFTAHPLYQEELEQHRFMSSRILAKLFSLASMGDVRAAKLYLDATCNSAETRTPRTIIEHQNNYIQINETVLSQETIKGLDPAQLESIERLLIRVLERPMSSD
jgi:Cdc6-like AAA superfamily ATPase